ncbi:hypothetical protein PWEIH_00590 [Listeria weihenstephanensis FSL R9-0317]|uniref:Uncharacterized protein n=1 Tax=Listeria weihenstephanensis TaxID=1006155 RepID=A0A1S7FSR2_9LIST|nr:hypothetical protein [Listeria weihenstephanensis]AQY50498.1 hypothetical protein UE46_05285 [Listeria phage LWP01] [Listeria weihenstephanensis]AQY52642.1 hypothetical protein UE46_p05285 [Listeria phage LWP01]EUJ41514.1 hypothetical protein PWEIH_00590 [Listeria weihenstephanensis FSL R9-0317]
MILPENKARQRELIEQLLDPRLPRAERKELREQLKELEDERVSKNPYLKAEYFLDEAGHRHNSIKDLSSKIYAELKFLDFSQVNIAVAFNASRVKVQKFYSINKSAINKWLERLAEQERIELDESNESE